MNDTIKHICKCGECVDIMSIVENKLEKDNKIIPIVKITYVCKKCGRSALGTHYLYKLTK